MAGQLAVRSVVASGDAWDGEVLSVGRDERAVGQSERAFERSTPQPLEIQHAVANCRSAEFDDGVRRELQHPLMETQNAVVALVGRAHGHVGVTTCRIEEVEQADGILRPRRGVGSGERVEVIDRSSLGHGVDVLRLGRNI